MASTSFLPFLLLLLLLLLLEPPAAVRAEGFSSLPAELAPVPCNDKVVEKLSRLALTYVNEDREDGYKFALNRIANVHLHAQGPAGNVYYLDLDVLETKCHIGSPKPWKRCDVRPFMETQISGNCNTTVLHTPEGYSYLYSYDCTLVPDLPGKLQQICPTCPLLLPTDNPQALHAAQVTLAHYRRRSLLSAGLAVKRITRASAQVVPEKVSLVEYTVHHCPGGVTGRGSCQGLSPLSDTETAGFCTGSIRGNININPEVQVSCEIFKMQNVDVLMPLEPQVHDLPLDPFIPTLAPPIDEPVPSDPPLPPAVANPTVPSIFDPIDPAILDPIDPAILDPIAPSVVDNPIGPFSSSSSSESAERSDDRRPPAVAAAAGPLDSSSEEDGGVVALRPPLNFRYQRRERRRRQALVETSPTHSPIFLADFPSGLSPFRSCPGPARYTTV